MATADRWRRPERLYDLLAPLARLLVWLLADLRVVGAERVPARGGVLLAANHVSFLDPVVLAAALYACSRRKVRFLAPADLFDHPADLLLSFDPKVDQDLLEGRPAAAS
jgi:1-acyl-sn-glycerol-3-phosphate acyltransferase